MLLINPPVVKPSEPPAALARLSGALSFHGIKHHVLDANIEGLEYLLCLAKECKAGDAFSQRALKNSDRNISAIKNSKTFESHSRYTKAVCELNRALELSSVKARVGLSDYHDADLSPVKSADLIRSAENFACNPFYDYFRNKIPALLEETNPEVIGISVNYLSQALSAFAMAGFIKSLSGNVRIVMGGGLITSWMSALNPAALFKGLIDDMVSGFGEDFLLALKGLERREEFCLPDYAVFDTRKYLSPCFILPYSLSGGCWWSKCSFCPERAEKNPYRPVEKKDFIEQLDSLTSRHSPGLIHFLDNAISPSALTVLADKKMASAWYGFARITKDLLDPDFCRQLAASGCIMLQLGIESGDQDVLDALNKGIEVRHVHLVLENLKKAGIGTFIYLLFGTPAEDYISAQKTLELIKRCGKEIDFLNLSIFNLPTYSEDATGLETYEFYEADLSLYKAFVHPKGWNRDKVRRFLDREFKRHPAVAKILTRTPAFFTSNHASLFLLNDSEKHLYY